MICFQEQSLIFGLLSFFIILLILYKLFGDLIMHTSITTSMTTPTSISPIASEPQAPIKSQLQNLYIQSESSRLYNPLSPPARRYESSRDYSNDYNVVGFVYNNETNEHYALFGKNHDVNHSDRKDYYVIDDKNTRFNIKIPVETKNYAELQDGDTVNIQTLGKTYNVSIYPVDKYIYNPDIY